MHVLVTGATGFIGRFVVDQLIAESRVKKVIVCSRNQLFHENDKVVCYKLDLSIMGSLNQIEEEIDVVVHLAGCYDFSVSSDVNYRSNVLATACVLDFVKSKLTSKVIPIVYSSTYAVYDPRASQVVGEDENGQSVNSEISYVSTKAMAERMIIESGLCAYIFRIGTVVGDSKYGQIIKYDGPYYLFKLLKSIAGAKTDKMLPVLPMPVSGEGIFPFVPVDYVAKVITRSIFKVPPQKPTVYGLYGDQVVFEGLFRWICERLSLNIYPVYLPDLLKSYPLPEAIFTGGEKVAELITSEFFEIPADSFFFVKHKISFNDHRFRMDFPELIVPSFASISDVLWAGFCEFEGEA